ncbi:MAG TPA: ATP-binding protein [Longimicrobium sp.]|jgi:PAS domain S-box-containing protein|uniref:PAS domain-containing sensor histidine kinase n=1 Tax=Longimicrobium sp. TaxID=2029185 RepID=UPI002ED960BB
MRTVNSNDPASAPRFDPEAQGPAPDPDATGAVEPPPQPEGMPGRETHERKAAWRRGEARAAERAGGSEPPRDPYSGLAHPGIAAHAFAALSENVRDYAIFLLDPDGVITFWGEGARLMKWWTQDEAEGGHLRLLYPDGGSEDGTAEEHLLQAARDGEYTGEGHRVRNDNSTFWAGVTLTALRDPEGNLLGYAKVTRDLTARRAADAALVAAHEAAEQARRHAEEASQMKSLFLATMSHEIRTPLNAVMAYTEILTMEMAGPLSPAQHAHLGRIRTSSQHLLAIIDDVLDLSRVEAGRMVVGRSVMQVDAVVSEALALVEPQASAKGVELSSAVSGVASELTAWGDSERIRQILLNLLTNAVKFTDPGGRITLSAGAALQPPDDIQVEGEGPWIYVRVEDTGKGIPADRVQAVFEPFVQADMTLTRQHGGSGLGLAISRRLARLMGGDLTLRSTEGLGSTFFFWLPAAPAEMVRADMGHPSVATPATTAILREVRDAILAEVERVLYGFVARLRSDPATPSAHARTEAELEDHLASFLSDVAQTFGGMDLAAGSDGEGIRDGSDIQRRISQRHGEQRFRLGWAESEVSREHQILSEELAAAIRRHIRRERPHEVEEMIDAVRVFLAAGERVSIESYRRAAGVLSA